MTLITIFTRMTLLCMVSDVDGGDAVLGSNALDGRRWDKYFCFPQVACGRDLWGGELCRMGSGQRCGVK